jgi:hypothetical protein
MRTVDPLVIRLPESLPHRDEAQQAQAFSGQLALLSPMHPFRMASHYQVIDDLTVTRSRTMSR